MSPVLVWFRLDLRRRWRSLAVLALLIGFASATVLTAVAGSRRGASAVDRLLVPTLPATVAVLPNEPGFDWDAIRALPEVEALTTFVVSAYNVDGIPPDDQESVASFAPGDDQAMHTIERPVVLDGRLADPTRPYEVVVSSRFVSSYGKGVGDTVTIRLATPEQLDAAVLDDAVMDDLEGPAIRATIVGVVRSPWYSDTTGSPGFVVPSAGLFAEYGPNLIGAKGSAYINALVRLDAGERGIPAFKEGLADASGRNDIDVWNMADFVRHGVDVTRFEANALLAFAVAAGLASVFLVGQAIVRYSAATAADLEILRAMGMTPAQARRAAVLGPVLAAVVGVAFGVGVAVVASRWFPIGTARDVEPAPGIDVDTAVLGLGAVAVVLLVVTGALGAAHLALQSRTRFAGPRRSPIVAATARTGLPVPVAVGAGLALERGPGRPAVPVRSALLGAVAGVMGVVAALTFSSGVSDAAAHLERFGQTYQLETFLGYNSTDFGPSDEALRAMAADPEVAAVNDTRTDVAQAEDEAVAVMTIDPVDAPVDTVVTRGRLPEGRGEVALAPRTAEATGLTVGDAFELEGSSGTEDVLVTGLAFVPALSHNNYASGALVTPDTYDHLFDGHKFHLGLLQLRPGADAGVVARRLADATGLPVQPPAPPAEVAELRQVRTLPIFLAGFLAVLALGAVGHALATAVRRRRSDLAVLRALGMTRRQARRVVITQATVLAVVGLVVGIPLGVALGRIVWQYVARSTPIQYLPPTAWLAVILVVPIAVLAANVLAVLPSRRAASMRVGGALRAE